MRKITLSIFALAMLSFVGIAYATAIPAVPFQSFGNSKGLFWETFTDTDTITAAKWQGGKGLIEVMGTPDTAILEMTFSTITGSEVSIDGDETPDGFLFTNTTGATLFNLPRGSIGISLTSAGGGSQDLDIKISPVRQ